MYYDAHSEIVDSPPPLPAVVSRTAGAEGSLTGAQLRGHGSPLEQNIAVQQLFQSVSQGRGHFGGRIAFDKNGFVFLTLGDRQVPPEGGGPVEAVQRQS